MPSVEFEAHVSDELARLSKEQIRLQVEIGAAAYALALTGRMLSTIDSAIAERVARMIERSPPELFSDTEVLRSFAISLRQTEPEHGRSSGGPDLRLVIDNPDDE
jgi:hypothetical protein